MLSPPNEQCRAGEIVRGAITLGRLLCREPIDGAVLDKEIETFIRDEGGVPALKGYNPPFSEREYEHTICLSLNNEVVHGVPARPVTPDDIISIDLVVGYQDWFADSARTFTHSSDTKKVRLVNASQVIFVGAQAAILPNQPMSLFGASVEIASQYVGYAPIREYCGHGIGQGIHMEPQILNYSHNGSDLFQVGRSYAVEPVLASRKTYVVKHDHPDGWTVYANCLTSHNEDTVFVSSNGIINLTGDNNE
jgi:methionyl aminopeptidase